MESISLWIILLIALALLAVVALIAFALGTRARVAIGSGCVVDHHWWFGWWVRCVDDDTCPDGQVCTLLWRRKGTEDHWADPGVVPGGSVRYNEDMEYRCVCR